MIVTTGLYVGRYKLRTGGGKVYIHIPIKLVGELASRKVRVVAIINALACNNRVLHGSLIAFTATLVEVGGTYRLGIPSRYASALRDVIDCVEIDVWVTPIVGRPARRGA
jgi:hypothetical protein